MRNIARLSDNDRRELFRNTADKMGLNDAIVEKDFWVCFTLDYLFHRSPWKESITFKGGTSLSRHWTEPILTRQNVHYPRILLASRATLSISSNSSSSSGSKSSSLVPLRSCCSDQLAEILHTRHTAIAATAMQFMNQINQAFRVFSNQLFLNFVANFRQEIE